MDIVKLCFSTLGCPDWGWGDILSAAKDLGYNGIEVRGVSDELFVPNIFAGKEENIKAELKRLNLKIACLTSACYLNEKDKMQTHISDGKKYIDTAKTMGVPFVRMLGDYQPHETGAVDVSVVKDMAVRLGEYAKAAGVSILLETNGFFASSERLAKLLSDINLSSVGALWDTHHPYRFKGEPVKTTYGNLKEWIKHVHMKDSVKEGKQVRYKIMGAGDMPIEAAVDALTGGGYDGYYSLEWTKRWNLELEEPGIVFATYVHYMQNL